MIGASVLSFITHPSEYGGQHLLYRYYSMLLARPVLHRLYGQLKRMQRRNLNPEKV